MAVSIAGNTFVMPMCAYCCVTGTGTESGCECDCCPTGYWTEYTFTIADMTPFFAAPGCSDYDGTWTLKYRGNRFHLGSPACVWSTDERTDGVMCEGDVTNHPFDVTTDPNPEKWLLYCQDGQWTLINAGTSVSWFLDDLGSPSVDFCIDGGLLLYVFADTSACCKWNGFSVSPTETNYLRVDPTGVFVPCE